MDAGEEMSVKTIMLEIDDADYAAIQKAISFRQTWNRSKGGDKVLPDGDGNQAGRVVAEICRGWMEVKQ